MNIVVLVKQVPDSGTQRSLDPSDNTVARAAADNVINEIDEYAIEEALQVKAAQGGEVTILTVGPASATDAIRKALSMGADRAVHVVDDATHGSRAIQTSGVPAAAPRPERAGGGRRPGRARRRRRHPRLVRHPDLRRARRRAAADGVRPRPHRRPLQRTPGRGHAGAAAPAAAATRPPGVLAAALRQMEYDLVLTGATSTDGQVAVMPALLSERPGIPPLPGGRNAPARGPSVRVARRTD